MKRARLLVAAAAATLVALGLSFWAVAAFFNGTQERRLDHALLAMATQAAARAVTPSGDLAIADGLGPEVNDSGPLPLYGAIYDEQGTPRASTATFAGAAPVTPILHGTREPFDLVIPGPVRLRAVMVAVPNLPHSFLLLAMPRTDLDGDAALLGRALATVFALACAWSVLVLACVVRRIARDHRADLEGLGAELESQKRLLAYAAHELRAPLTIVHGQLALALRRPRDEAEYRSAIGEALDAASDLRALAEDLLDLERARGRSAAPLEAIPVARIVRNAARYVEADAARRAVTLDLEVKRGAVLGREADLERLVRNLLENAVRHSPPGGRVLVEATSEGDDIRLAVTDEGDGVPEVDRARIFEPFFRATSGDAPGAGLGLAIVQEIARAHGGEVALDPAPARGARFVVRLPAVATPTRGEPAPTTQVAAA